MSHSFCPFIYCTNGISVDFLRGKALKNNSCRPLKFVNIPKVLTVYLLASLNSLLPFLFPVFLFRFSDFVFGYSYSVVFDIRPVDTAETNVQLFVLLFGTTTHSG